MPTTADPGGPELRRRHEDARTARPVLPRGASVHSSGCATRLLTPCDADLDHPSPRRAPLGHVVPAPARHGHGGAQARPLHLARGVRRAAHLEALPDPAADCPRYRQLAQQRQLSRRRDRLLARLAPQGALGPLPRARAQDADSSSSRPQLQDVRTATGSTTTPTLLHYLVRVVRRQDASLLAILDDLPHVEAASRSASPSAPALLLIL